MYLNVKVISKPNIISRLCTKVLPVFFMGVDELNGTSILVIL